MEEIFIVQGDRFHLTDLKKITIAIEIQSSADHDGKSEKHRFRYS